MKKVSLIFGFMLLCLSCLANNEVSEASLSEVSTSASSCVSFKENQLSLSQSSKLIITDKKGHVIFYNEHVEYVDFSEWQSGTYTAQVNDSETFEFTL